MRIDLMQPHNISDFIENLKILDSKVKNLRLISDTHRRWFTHKNPYGCWICDLIDVAEQLIDETSILLSPNIDKDDATSRRLDSYQETTQPDIASVNTDKRYSD